MGAAHKLKPKSRYDKAPLSEFRKPATSPLALSPPLRGFPSRSRTRMSSRRRKITPLTTPDLCIQLCILVGTNDPELTTFRDLVVVESAYSQSETSVLKKFVHYIQCNPTLLTLLMVGVKGSFSKPSNSSDLATIRHCMNKEVLNELDFKWKVARCLYQVVHEGISWIDIAQLKVHLWLHLGDKPIENPNHSETIYTFGIHFILTKHCNFLLICSTLKTLYPTLSINAIDGLLGRTIMKPVQEPHLEAN